MRPHCLIRLLDTNNAVHKLLCCAMMWCDAERSCRVIKVDVMSSRVTHCRAGLHRQLSRATISYRVPSCDDALHAGVRLHAKGQALSVCRSKTSRSLRSRCSPACCIACCRFTVNSQCFELTVLLISVVLHCEPWHANIRCVTILRRSLC